MVVFRVGLATVKSLGVIHCCTWCRYSLLFAEAQLLKLPAEDVLPLLRSPPSLPPAELMRAAFQLHIDPALIAKMNDI